MIKSQNCLAFCRHLGAEFVVPFFSRSHAPNMVANVVSIFRFLTLFLPAKKVTLKTL